MSEPKRTRGRTPILSRQAVLDAARDLPAHEVTLAEVSARLGVTSPALYRYFPDRAAILEALATEAREQLTPPSPDLPWDDWLREAGRKERSLWRTHADLYGSAGYRANATPMVRIAVQGMKVLAAAGFSAADALAGVTIIAELGHAIGHAELQRTNGSDDVSPETAEEVRGLLADALPFDFDRLLEQTMDIAIDGLRLRLGPAYQDR